MVWGFGFLGPVRVPGLFVWFLCFWVSTAQVSLLNLPAKPYGLGLGGFWVLGGLMSLLTESWGGMEIGPWALISLGGTARGERSPIGI